MPLPCLPHVGRDDLSVEVPPSPNAPTHPLILVRSTRLFIWSNVIFDAWAVVYTYLLETCGGENGTVNCFDTHVQVYTLSRGFCFLVVGCILAVSGYNFLVVHWEDVKENKCTQIMSCIIMSLVPLATLERGVLWLYFGLQSTAASRLLPSAHMDHGLYEVLAYTIPCLIPSILLLSSSSARQTSPAA